MVEGGTSQDPALERTRSRAWSRDWLWLAGILILGALLRGWYLMEIRDAPDFRALRQDLDVQDYHARAIISGDWDVRPDVIDPEIRTTPYYRPPGYAYFLTAVYFLTGGSYLAPRLIHMALGLASAVLMYLLGRHVFGRVSGLLTAFFVATYWGFIYYEGEVNDPALFVFLVACLLLALRRWAVSLAPSRAMLLGGMFGVYAIMRPNILLFGPVVAAWMLHVAWRRGQWRRMLLSWFWLALVCGLAIAPVTVRNYIVSGEFVPISTYFGENLLIGNAEDADGYTSWTPYLQHLEGTGNFSVWFYGNIVRGLGKEVGRPDLTHSEASEVFARKALDYIRTHKLRTAQLWLKKAILFWSPLEITENKVVQGEKDYYPPLKYLPGFPLVTALFLTGTILFLAEWRRNRAADAAPGAPVTPTQMAAIIFAFILTYFASFLPFFVNARARAPLYGVCLLIGAYGLQRIIEWLRGGAWGRAALGVALAAGLFVLASVQYVPYEPDMARWHYARADSYLRDGRVEQAAAESEAMLALPGDPMPYMPFRLGHAFARADRHLLAYRLLKTALDTDPGNQHPRYRQDLQYHVARQLYALDRNTEALAAYEEALRLNPDDPRAHNDIALILWKAGRVDEALTHFEAALRAHPGFALAHSNLADLLGSVGRLDEAIEHFRQAAAHAPKNGEYAFGLARVLAAAGRIEDAITQYQTAITLAPRDPRAYNNLGLLLEARGDPEGAVSRYREAIRVAPGFSLAYANLAALLARAGRVGEGVLLCRTGLEQTPDDPVLHNALGYLLALQGQSQEALEHYDAALRSDPDYAQARQNREKLLSTAGR
ncbi:MAG: tetratricopeptide repeat protein [Candidatus Hydrogenedentes bacterium]|nr:tetratricopeptide repeat protein [Candidatus Hydrogenedentota bacterium]